MGIVFRQSIKTSMVIFLGAILGTVITWMSAKYLPTQQFGFTKTLTNIALVASQISLLGLNSTIVVYIHKYTGADPRRKVLLTIFLLLPVLLVAVCVAPFLLLRPWVLNHFQPADAPYIDRYYWLIPAFTILFILMILLEQYLGTQMKVAVSAFMREVVLRVASVATIILFAMGLISFRVFVVSSVFIYLLPVVICLALAYKTKGFGFSTRFRAFTNKEYKELIHFSWFHFLLAMSITLMNYMDALALPLYNHNGLSSVAVYTVATLLISFMQMPSKAMLQPTVTVLSQAINEDNMAKAKDIFERSSINILLATAFMAVIITCNLDNAMAVLNKGYTQVGLVFVILCIGRFVDLATGLNDAILSITNHYKFTFYVSLAMIALLFTLIKLLVPAYGVFGAAWATTITLITFNICKFVFVWTRLGMQPFSKQSIFVLMAAGGALAIGYYFPRFHIFSNSLVNVFTDVALRSAALSVVYLLLVYLLKPSPDFSKFVGGIKANKKLF